MTTLLKKKTEFGQTLSKARLTSISGLTLNTNFTRVIKGYIKRFIQCILQGLHTPQIAFVYK